MVSRVIVDANVLISYILSPDETGKIVRAVELLWDTSIELLLPDILIDEVCSTVNRKPYLHDRISVADLDNLIEALRTIATPVHQDKIMITPSLRDRKDDYLLDAAVRFGADYLVTGDRDLLVIRDDLDQPKICTVTEFLDLFSANE